MIALLWLAAKAALGGMSGRAWAITAALAAFAAWSAVLYGAGYSAADNRWKAKALEARIARLERELRIERDADVAEDRLRAELEQETHQQKQAIDAYLAELDRRAGKCLLGPDASRLQ
jgi:hypothetical protein